MPAFAAIATAVARRSRTPRYATGFTQRAATRNLHAMNDVAEVSDESLMLAYAAGDAAAREEGERGLLPSDLLPWLRRLANPVRR